MKRKLQLLHLLLNFQTSPLFAKQAIDLSGVLCFGKDWEKKMKKRGDSL